jgi:hypothetical protein
MHLLTNIPTHIIPQHNLHTITRDLTTTTGITITLFITTTLSSRAMAVGSLFHKARLVWDLCRVPVSPLRETSNLVVLIQALPIHQRSSASPRLNRETRLRIGKETICPPRSTVKFAADMAADLHPHILHLGCMKIANGHSQHRLQ